jgi:hypothetical protein
MTDPRAKPVGMASLCQSINRRAAVLSPPVASPDLHTKAA